MEAILKEYIIKELCEGFTYSDLEFNQNISVIIFIVKGMEQKKLLL